MLANGTGKGTQALNPVTVVIHSVHAFAQSCIISADNAISAADCVGHIM